MRYFEDFAEGQVYDLGELRVSEPEIVEFARKYDPQAFHVDPEAAQRSIFGGLIASGCHTGSMYMGLLVRGLLQQSATLGSPGVDEMRWLKPVRAGDPLRGRVTTTSATPASTHASRGPVSTLRELGYQQC